MALTNTAVEKAKAKDKNYLVFDSDGLYLKVCTTGRKVWVLRSFVGHKERKITLGEYPTMSLLEARKERDSQKMLIRTGQNISLSKMTFGELSRKWLLKKSEKVTPEHLDVLRQRVNSYLLATLEWRPVNEITRPELLAIVSRLANRGVVETARRTAAIAKSILDLALLDGIIEVNVASEITAALPGWKTVNFKTTFDPVEICKLLRAIDGYSSQVVKSCLKLIAYTFVRAHEATASCWSEFNLDKAEWRIPASHTKARREQIVPLSRQVVAVLKDMQLLSELRWPNKDLNTLPVFPVSREMTSGRMNIARATPNVALRLMRDRIPEPLTPPPMNVHGFRHMASTLLNEAGWPHEAIERQLAHVGQDRTEATYNKAKLLPIRRQMMQWYADYLDALRDGYTIPKMPNL